MTLPSGTAADDNVVNDQDVVVVTATAVPSTKYKPLLQSVRLTSPISTGGNGLTILYRGRRGMLSPMQTLHHDTWDTILCEGIPISLREMVLLVADRLKLAVDMTTANKLLLCSWSLGWHVNRISLLGESCHFWGGGVTSKTSSKYLRGDWVEIEGTDRQMGVQTSRLARVICGVQLHDVRKLFNLYGIRRRTSTAKYVRTLPPRMWETQINHDSGTVSFLLVRYLQAHQSTRRGRGPKHRPLCPGVLHDTHCLWSWAQRGVGFRRGCFRGRAWDRNRKFFGKTEQEQNRRQELESRSWYDVIQSSEILRYANVQSDPDRDNAFLQSVMWC